MNQHRASPPLLTATERAVQAGYDALHTARAGSNLVDELYAEAMGDAHPPDVRASSSCDWPLIGAMVADLRMSPGGLLVDLGCGTGGTGLWLARALALRLTGIDISPAAVDIAADRAPHFLPSARATFRVGSVERTGLPGRAAQGLICVDALGHAADRAEALREIHRVLAPGARAVVTAAARRDTQPAWHADARAAGLTVELVRERPGEPAMWQRLYKLWQAHEADLIRELGEDQARSMLGEAAHRLPTLAGRRAVVLTLRRPLRCTDQHTTAEEG